jgi:hypothetical protein
MEVAQTTGVAECGKYDTLLQGGNRRPAPCAGRTGLSPAYEQRPVSGAGQRAEGLQPQRDSTLSGGGSVSFRFMDERVGSLADYLEERVVDRHVR